MLQMLLQIENDSLNKVLSSSNEGFSSSIWFWISIIELLIIVLLLIRYKKRSTSLDFNDIPKSKLKNAKSSSIDMDNLMNSINGANELYKELSRQCHPDRFVNSEKHGLAEEIFQEISNNKRNFNALQELKLRAKKELLIK